MLTLSTFPQINEQNEVIFTNTSKLEADFADDNRRLVVDDSPAPDRPQDFAADTIQIVEAKHDVDNSGGGRFFCRCRITVRLTGKQMMHYKQAFKEP